MDQIYEHDLSENFFIHLNEMKLSFEKMQKRLKDPKAFEKSIL